MVSVAGILKESKTNPTKPAIDCLDEQIDLLGCSYFVGYDDDGNEVVAVKSSLDDIGLVEMTGGGPFDGARCLIMSIETSAHDSPVEVIFSDEDSARVFDFCASFLVTDETLYEFDDDLEGDWEWGYYDEDDDPEMYL